MYSRYLKIDLPDQKSAFLWRARQTDKSSYLKAHFQSSVYYDLLGTHEVVRLIKEPHLLREELIQLDQKSRKEPIICGFSR